MPNDFVIIKDALSRIERDKQNSWTEYVELIGTIDDLETEVSEFIDSAYTWQERAIKAEAKFTECRKAAEVLQSEVERLQTLLETFNGECVVCDSVSEITRVQTELSLLHKVVVDAARDVVGFGPCHDANSYWSLKKLSNALDEYDKAKEGQ